MLTGSLEGTCGTLFGDLIEDITHLHFGAGFHVNTEILTMSKLYGCKVKLHFKR